MVHKSRTRQCGSDVTEPSPCRSVKLTRSEASDLRGSQRAVHLPTGRSSREPGAAPFLFERDLGLDQIFSENAFFLRAAWSWPLGAQEPRTARSGSELSSDVDNCCYGGCWGVFCWPCCEFRDQPQVKKSTCILAPCLGQGTALLAARCCWRGQWAAWQ